MFRFLKEKIEDIVYKIKGKYRNLKNFFLWLPIIYEDRNYDQNYLFKILRHKFQHMERFFKSERAYSADADETARKLKICRILCERIIKDDYTTMFDERHEPILEKFSRKFDRFMDSNELVLDYEEESALDSKISIWKYEAEDYMLKQDVNLLCKILQKHVLEFWD